MENIQVFDEWFGSREELDVVAREMELASERMVENEVDDGIMARMESIVMIGEGGDLNAYAH